MLAKTYLLNAQGQVADQRSLAPGINTWPLSLPPGLYFLPLSLPPGLYFLPLPLPDGLRYSQKIIVQ